MYAIITVQEPDKSKPLKWKVAYANIEEENRLKELGGKEYGRCKVLSVEIKRKGRTVSFQHFASFHSSFLH